MRQFILRYLVIMMILFSISRTYSQVDLPPALEGGRGFINTQTAYNFGKGYLGVKFVGIYTNKKLFQQNDREHLFIEATSLTYDFSDEAEFSAVLYSIARGIASPIATTTSSGFGKSVLGFKYEFPLNSENIDFGFRSAFHIPMGANFMIHPSYPYDTEVYSVELMLLQSFGLSSGFRVHLNEGYRWQGLRKEYVNKEDLFSGSLALDYNLGKNLYGYSEVASLIENDDLIEPLQDRFIFTQGFRYVTPWNLGINLSANFRLNEKRSDGTPTRAENWRVMLGCSFSTRTFKPDTDKDGIPDKDDLEPNTPADYLVDSRGRALDSDMDGIPDGIDQESQTPKGAKVDKLGRSMDSDKDGILDGLDKEPNTPTGAKVDAKGVAIDSDDDGVADGIDQEQNTLKGAVVNVRGVAIDSDGDGIPDGIDQEPNSLTGVPVDKDGVAIKSDMEIALLTKGLIRVQKIYFDLGKSNIKPESFGILNEIGRILEKYPDLKIEVGGHTDATGSTEINQRLSLERARSVKNFLLSRFTELNEDNLSVSGYGLDKPIADNNTDEGRTLNRRVEFKVLNLDQIKK